MFLTELIKKISEISDVYEDFVLGVISYAKKDSAHVRILNDYLEDNPDLTTSDMVEFIIRQPDFHRYSAASKQNSL